MANSFAPIFRATFYTDKSLAELGLGKLNVGARARGAVQAYHRGNIAEDDEAPFSVANEFICSEVGRLLGLAIPPSAITHSDIEPYRPLFSCLDFAWTDETLVNAEPDRVVADHLEEATGLVMFDILVVNPDRESWNLKTDDPLKPQFMRVYDHADALFSTEGESRLATLFNDIGFAWPHGGIQSHFLVPCLFDGRYRHAWYDRLGRLPDFQLANICKAARATGLTKAQSGAALDFLRYRKTNMETIIEGRKEFFQPSFFDAPKGDLV